MGHQVKKKKKMEIAFQLALSVLELSELMQPVSDIWIFNIHVRQLHNCGEGGQRDARMQSGKIILWRKGEGGKWGLYIRCKMWGNGMCTNPTKNLKP